MDDRLTLAMYFEMTARDPHDYRSTRGKDVSALPGVHRMSYWRSLNDAAIHDAVPHRAYLALYEVSLDFTSPAAADGDVTLHFRQARPGQGRLSRGPARSLWTVMVQPKTDDDVAFRDWADFTHLPAILDAQLPGFHQVTPYRNVEPSGVPRFLHFWDLDTDDPEAGVAGLGPAMVGRFGQGTDEFNAWLAPPDGYDVVHRALYVPA